MLLQTCMEQIIWLFLSQVHESGFEPWPLAGIPAPPLPGAPGLRVHLSSGEKPTPTPESCWELNELI